VIWATWTAFRDQPEIVVLRVVFSLLIAVIVGFVFSFQKDLATIVEPAIARYLKFNPPANPEGKRPTRNQLVQQQQATVPTLLQSGTYLLGGQAGQTMRIDANAVQANMATSKPSKPLADKLRLLVDNCVQELRELGAVLVIGSAIAAAIQVSVPREFIISLGAGPISSITAMMVLAAVVSICSTVDSFFALSFASTFTSGSLLAFLVFGPMIDIKGIGLLLSIFKPRAVVYLFVLAGQLTFLFTLFINLHVI
jgi:hypothetical protein